MNVRCYQENGKKTLRQIALIGVLLWRWIMTLYMAVSNDRYELPIAVADSQSELARMVKLDISYVCKQIHGAVKVKGKAKIRLFKIDVDSDED